MINTEQKQQIETLVNQRFQSIASNYKKSIADLEAMLSREVEARHTLVDENKALRADLLHLQSQRENARLNVTGKGDLTPVKMSENEKANLLLAKLADTRLEDVVIYDAMSRGINPKNNAEFQSFLGLKEGE